MSAQILYMPQGSEEWFAARCGFVTASRLNDVMAQGQGKTRQKYLYTLIGERMTGEPAESFSNAHTERGHEHEPMARDLYEVEHDATVEQVGIILNDEGVGFSPDGLVGDDGSIEIKSKLPHLQAEVLDKGEVPTEHLKQIQGGLWVSEREWLDFISYWPGMPLFVKRVYRDESSIEAIAEAVEQFYSDLEKTMNRIMEQSQ